MRESHNMRKTSTPKLKQWDATRPMRFDIGAFALETRIMSAEEAGMYGLLIGAYWILGGPLPDCDDRLARAATSQVASFRAARPILCRFFSVGGGVWQHERTELEIARIHRREISAGLRLDAAEWAVVRAEVFDRDDYTCRYCGERGGVLHCDHVIPIAKGGTNATDNLATACEPCNRAKAAKIVDVTEFSAQRRSLALNRAEA